MAGLLIGTDSSSYSTITGAETLTNKTLTTPTIASMANCTFPTGHVIATYADVASLAATHRSASATVYLVDPEVSVPSGLSTGDNLLVTGSLSICSNDTDNGGQINVGFAYSTDDFTTPVQLGPNEYTGIHHLWHNDQGGEARERVDLVTYTAVPSTSAFKVRIKLNTHLTPYAPINSGMTQYICVQLIKG